MGGLDLAMVTRFAGAMSKMNDCPDDRARLLQALRPFLRPERRARLDEALQILKWVRMLEFFREER